ncbi:MAG: hemerythrin domain-containing protein [Deltaproteobacteria bacterium]|nr:hemerythrin domain-containing protein [Deltaproteobacteria bacterium]
MLIFRQSFRVNPEQEVREMSEKELTIKYKCLHPSCVVYCKEGELSLPESLFTQLSSFYEGERIFKSPKDACRMGFSQPFEVLAISERDENLAEQEQITQPTKDGPGSAADPISALIAEHKKVLEKLERVEEHLVKRDIAGLWVSTAALDNILHLHGGIKEEEILFPALRGLVPFGEGLVACINEDHREIVSLVYTFREALRDGNINDKIIGSAIVALRSHIRKEDNEFFEFVKKYINDEMKQAIMSKMERADKTFVPQESGERLPDEQKAIERAKFHEKTVESREIACDTCCH